MNVSRNYFIAGSIVAMCLTQLVVAHAALPSFDSGGGATGLRDPQKVIENEERILKELDELELNVDESAINRSQSGNNAQSSGDSQSIQPRPMIPPSGELVMYRQNNYQNPLPQGCTFSFAGCGPSAVANIVANLKNRAVTPTEVIDEYRRQGSYLGCSGSTMAGAKKVLENSYGFTTFEIIPEISAPLSIPQAVAKIKPFIDAGNWIFIGANYSGGGHYAVLTDIKETPTGYTLYALDSVYGNPSVIPVNYSYMHPYPRIKKAMAVYPN